MSIYLIVFLSATFWSATGGMVVEQDWRIYYDMATNRTIETISISNPRLKVYRNYARQLRIGFGPIPCSCQDLTCGCCAGMNIQMFNFDRHACMNFTYDPREFAIVMNMYMNNESLYSNSISGKNPPPACVPVPIPYIPSVDFCIRFFNIHTTGNNIFTCIDFETRMERAPLLILHFDCLRMGQDGISMHKPGEGDIEEEIEAPTQQEDEQIFEVYDEVVEENLPANSTVDVTQQEQSNEGKIDSARQQEANRTLHIWKGNSTEKYPLSETLATTAVSTTNIPAAK